MDEQQLIDQLTAGGPRAVDQLCEQYRDRIYAVVRPRVKDDWDAEEVTQDVLMKVCTKIETFRGDSALWSWMYRIAVNEAAMKTRTYKRRPVPVSNGPLAALRHEDDDGDFDDRPDEHLAGREILAEIAEYLGNSTPKNTAVYLDMEWRGRDKEEVAEKLGLTPAAVKTRLHRMRVGLRDKIRREYLTSTA